MLELLIKGGELFNSSTNEFIQVQPVKLQLEHSLISISKWEAKWKKPFNETDKTKQKTTEEFLDYIRCMTINKNIDPLIYMSLSNDELEKIIEYIDDSMTATWFSEITENSVSFSSRREIITSELIYYYMIKAGIPLECEKWHFNRLLTLIRVFGIKDGGEKKMTKRQILNQNKTLNEQRKKKFGTKG